MQRAAMWVGAWPLVAAAVVWAAAAAPKVAKPPTEEELKKVEAAAAAQAPAKPAQPRKVLVWGRMAAHDPNVICARTMEILGRKTGAFTAVVSEAPDDLAPEKLAAFDALVMNNVHEREPFLPADLKSLPADAQQAAAKKKEAIQRGILDFVSGGKGLAGIHAATAAFQTWPEYGEMIGGYYGGHLTQEVPLKVEDPKSPLCAMFDAKGFRITDEIYIPKDPYSREKVRVLLSLDLAQMDDPAKRPDKDYAISWVREYGKGRVFYCALGHAAPTYWNPAVLRHFLAGVQYALGDLKADATPSAKATK
jgi:hypothetical protein